MPSLKALLVKRECTGGKPALEVYEDSLGFLTVGIGHRVVAADKLKLRDTIDETRVDAFFMKDTAKALSAARYQAGRARINNPYFIVSLAAVNFQLGTRWTRKHAKTWQMIVDGDYKGAAEEVKRSRWAKQTPIRVRDFQRALLALPQPEPEPPAR